MKRLLVFFFLVVCAPALFSSAADNSAFARELKEQLGVFSRHRFVGTCTKPVLMKHPWSSVSAESARGILKNAQSRCAQARLFGFRYFSGNRVFFGKTLEDLEQLEKMLTEDPLRVSYIIRPEDSDGINEVEVPETWQKYADSGLVPLKGRLDLFIDVALYPDSSFFDCVRAFCGCQRRKKTS